ncbi:MAG: flagellar FliJ family protein [Acidobacteria bacterium]|nr:flagellar FliJ family protein [Acidobacteriota bacterium]
MAKFKFSLQALLKHVEEMERRERDVLLRLSYSYQVAFRHRETLERKRRETATQLCRRQAENIRAGELDCYRLYLRRLADEIEESEKKLRKLDSEIRRQKAAVMEIMKRRKVISALRAKREKEFYNALEKKEQKEVEEWVAARYAALRQSMQQQIP